MINRGKIILGLLILLLSLTLLVLLFRSLPILGLEIKELFVESLKYIYSVLTNYLLILLIFQKHLFGKYIDILIALCGTIGIYMINIFFFSVSIQPIIILQILIGGSINLIFVYKFHKYLSSDYNISSSSQH